VASVPQIAPLEREFPVFRSLDLAMLDMAMDQVELSQSIDG